MGKDISNRFFMLKNVPFLSDLQLKLFFADEDSEVVHALSVGCLAAERSNLLYVIDLNNVKESASTILNRVKELSVVDGIKFVIYLDREKAPKALVRLGFTLVELS